ncbi:TPA: hypothetical protein HA235_01715 [Candidatus Woesearchaeota archaeon]|nr:hypothetical protein [Candidatus Woesearchaeota archaeon]HIH31401.1 hypothetical protein [Candidatus Woesearchaeota archaeon]HIH55166.1 hypothetical protein [Candidatus Woesearchaeota archaeon]HIJ01084.1 hypothetical protein [Candidatus Woesearchaeota archaeon]HIJ14114.1 hypothetical protein [Candidatus Woesearchaeota archaeon]
MLRFDIMNSKETKHILEKLQEQYGFGIEKKDLDYIFLQTKEGRLYVVSRDLGNIDFDKLRIDMLGIYFGEIYKDKLRLSIEGAQIIGKNATKNILDLDYAQMIEWIQGKDIEFTDCGEEFVIVRYKNPKTDQYDILGCGKFNKQSGKLMNYVSKSRKLVVVNN